MKIKLKTRDFKIGILVIGTFFLVYYGLHFLKGVDIFTPANYYYAEYDDLGGLVASTPVYIKGYKVGNVDEVKYDFTKKNPFTIKVSVLKNIKLPIGTKITMHEDGLIGGKAIKLIIPNYCANSSFYSPGDTLKSQVEKPFLEEIADNMLPKFEAFLQHADSLIQSLRFITENESLTKSIKNIETTTNNFSQSSAEMKNLLANDFPELLNKANNLFGELGDISKNLNQIDYNQTFSELDETIKNIKKISEKANDTNNSLGSLLNDKTLYENILSLTGNVDSLLIDLKDNPKRYVHFSVFGKK